jgi:hypothetical protein
MGSAFLIYFLQQQPFFFAQALSKMAAISSQERFMQIAFRFRE